MKWVYPRIVLDSVTKTSCKFFFLCFFILFSSISSTNSSKNFSQVIRKQQFFSIEWIFPIGLVYQLTDDDTTTDYTF